MQNRSLSLLVVTTLPFFFWVPPAEKIKSAFDLILSQIRQRAFNRLAPGATRLLSLFPRRPG